jgi:acyl-CoA oxidase
MDIVRSEVSRLCQVIRKDAVPITDAFNFTDFIINSPLGKYDGNIYESYFDRVNTSYAPGQIAPYFQTHVF